MNQPSHFSDLATIKVLRRDLALQIARHVEGRGDSQASAARALGIPQPTLSKIIHGRVANLSLELMLRIATRAQLKLVLLTGKEPAEAGVFVSSTATPRRAQRSLLADRAREELSVRAQRLSPEQRLDAQLRHSELLAELRCGAEASQSGRADKRPARQRAARTRNR
jgi:predicted XRE-type DNA-binding protein